MRTSYYVSTLTVAQVLTAATVQEAHSSSQTYFDKVNVSGVIVEYEVTPHLS